MNENWVVNSILDLQEHGGSAHAASHGNSGTDRVALDASQIISGTIDIGRIPAAALERVVTVANQTARYALTTATVQNGDSVYQTDIETIFLVKDDTNLNNANGYLQYKATADWNTLTNKPSTFPPSSHTHTIADVSDFPDYIPFSANLTKSNKDSNGIYKTCTWELPNAKVVSGQPAKWTSVLSGGTSPKYTYRTVTVYGSNKTTVLRTYTFSRSYDSDGDLLSETLS